MFPYQKIPRSFVPVVLLICWTPNSSPQIPASITRARFRDEDNLFKVEAVLFRNQIKFSLINPSVNQSSSSFGGHVNNNIARKITAVPRVNAEIAVSTWFDGWLITRKLKCESPSISTAGIESLRIPPAFRNSERLWSVFRFPSFEARGRGRLPPLTPKKRMLVFSTRMSRE